MSRYIAILFVAALGGCGPRMTPDQCLRANLFKQCMTLLPAGPQATKYNDWDEVVDSCAQAAYYQSLRAPQAVSAECRSSDQ